MSGPPNDHTGPPATYAEKVAAFEALTPNEWARLCRFAINIARNFSGRVNDADGDDLVQEFAARIYNENDPRNWYPGERSFFNFAAGVIKSDASNWSRKATISDSKNIASAEGRISRDVDGLDSVSKRPRFTELTDDLAANLSPQERLEAEDALAERLAGMRAVLTSRPYAAEIFDLKLQGRKEADIVKILGITNQEYGNTMKWIFRTLRARKFPV